MAAGKTGSTTAAETPPARHADGAAVQPRTAPEAPAFPGCTPVHLPRAELERFDRRLEYWDAATETAWVCEPVTAYHERPARLLGRLAERIAQVRGSRIDCYGSMDLLLRDDRGEPQSIMQADESLYLHLDRARLPGAAMVIGEDDFPDVVLEVDHSTDAAAGQAVPVRVVGLPGSMGGRAGGAVSESPACAAVGADDSRVGGRSLPVGGGEPRGSGMDGGGDTRGAERTGTVGADERGAGSGWVACWARGKERDRTTTRCCDRSGELDSSAAGWKAVRKG